MPGWEKPPKEQQTVATRRLMSGSSALLMAYAQGADTGDIARAHGRPDVYRSDEYQCETSSLTLTRVTTFEVDSNVRWTGHLSAISSILSRKASGIAP